MWGSWSSDQLPQGYRIMTAILYISIDTNINIVICVGSVENLVKI